MGRQAGAANAGATATARLKQKNVTTATGAYQAQLTHANEQTAQQMANAVESAKAARSRVSFPGVAYLPTIRSTNEPGSMGPRGGPAGRAGAPGGAGANSADISKMWFVFRSIVSVLATGMVVRFCSTTKLVGLFSLITVSVPSLCELNASIVDGLNTAPSVPAPIGTVVMILPSLALRITIVWGLRQATNRTWLFALSASPAHVPPLPTRSYVARLRTRQAL